MTGRERILAAIDHKEPDKIPVDCGGERSTTMQAIAYNNLKKYLGITEGKTKINDTVQQCIVPEQWFLDKFQIDAIDLARAFAEDPSEWKDFTLNDGSTAQIQSWINMERRDNGTFVVNEKGEDICVMPHSGYVFDQSVFPLYGIQKEEFDDLAKYMPSVMWSYLTDPLWTKYGDENFTTLLRNNAKRLYEETDSAIVFGFGGSVFEYGQYLYRTDELLMNLILRKDEIKKMIEKLTEIHIDLLDQVLDIVAPYIQVIRMGDDLGIQTGPMISTELYHELYYPLHKKIFQRVKDKTGLPIYFHTCGAMSEFLPDLIDCGVDIINPVQTNAAGMDPVKLKKEYGKDMVFWGAGVDTQSVLPFGTPDEVRANVRQTCEYFMKDGGFVFAAVHNILSDVPPENIVAMFDEVNKISY